MERVNADDLYNAAVRRLNGQRNLPEVNENTDEDSYRFCEYKMLVKSSGGDNLNFHSINYTISIIIHRYMIFSEAYH